MLFYYFYLGLSGVADTISLCQYSPGVSINAGTTQLMPGIYTATRSREVSIQYAGTPSQVEMPGFNSLIVLYY